MAVRVRVGQLLMQFTSPNIDAQLEQSSIKIASLRWELSFHGQEKSLSNRHQVVVSELDSAISEYDSLTAEKSRLAVLAPFDGEVIELNDQLTIGEWIAKDESLLSIGQFTNFQLEAFVAEAYLSQIQAGVPAEFYPEQLDWPSLPCRVIRIDNAAATQLSPVFTSKYQGSIAIRGNNKDVLVPEASVYRVWLQPETKLSIFRALKGTVLIDGKSESIATSLARQVMAVFIRESGF